LADGFCPKNLAFARKILYYCGGAENAGLENARLENDGLKSRAGKCRTGK